MVNKSKSLAVAAGIAVGLAAGWFLFGASKPAEAGNDRHEDYVLCTGPVSVQLVGSDMDGVWLIDYKAGKLLGTVINRNTGKLNAFAEVDLVKEFEVPPRANVHFLMTTGNVARGQAALYIAEPTTGKLNAFAEVDLVKEFEVPPRANVHFLMTTGNVARGQAALYVAEPTTGKMGIYTMNVTEGQNGGVSVKRHDMVQFRPGVKPGDK